MKRQALVRLPCRRRGLRAARRAGARARLRQQHARARLAAYEDVLAIDNAPSAVAASWAAVAVAAAAAAQLRGSVAARWHSRVVVVAPPRRRLASGCGGSGGSGGGSGRLCFADIDACVLDATLLPPGSVQTVVEKATVDAVLCGPAALRLCREVDRWTACSPPAACPS